VTSTSGHPERLVEVGDPQLRCLLLALGSAGCAKAEGQGEAEAAIADRKRPQAIHLTEASNRSLRMRYHLPILQADDFGRPLGDARVMAGHHNGHPALPVELR